jgi:hypothetical protein
VLAEAFAHVLDLGDEFGLETLLGDIIANRTAIRRFIAYAERHGGIGVELKRALGLGPADAEDSIAAAYWPLPGLSGLTLDLYLALADQKGGQKVTEVAYGLRLVAKEPDVLKRAQHLDQIFLTREGKPKADSSLVAKAMTTTAPELADAIAAARAHVVACRDRLRLIRMFLATKAALTLAQRLNDDYEDLKKQRSLLDFEDLIARTADTACPRRRRRVGALQARSGHRPHSRRRGAGHQPRQWTVIKSLAEDFYSGAAPAKRRTIFAVGDEKQSIYSFQGARPERFAEERTRRKSGCGPATRPSTPCGCRSPSAPRPMCSPPSTRCFPWRRTFEASGAGRTGAAPLQPDRPPGRRRPLGRDRAGSRRAGGRLDRSFRFATPDKAPVRHPRPAGSPTGSRRLDRQGDDHRKGRRTADRGPVTSSFWSANATPSSMR